MKFSSEVGFTILETILFLSITALLATGVLAGIGTSINVQRYRDSVTSLQSVLQQQYSEVSNVSNDNAKGCDDKPRGQSDCVILGRYITTENNKILSIQRVIGQIPPGSVSSLDDVGIFKQPDGYNAKVIPSYLEAAETYEIEWGSSLVKPNNGGSMTFSILILRSPISGTVRTFINRDSVVTAGNIQDNDNGLITPIALTTAIKMCVEPSGGLSAGNKTAVEIMANSTGPTGVEVSKEATSGC
jgi:type II secretory pathway pseudopilin PulG